MHQSKQNGMIQTIAMGLLLLAQLAFAQDEDTLTFQGKKLVLNGTASYHYNVVVAKIHVYDGKFFLEKKSTNPAEIIGSDSIKAYQMKFFRDVNSSQLVSGTQDSFKKRCKDQPCKTLESDIRKLTTCFKTRNIQNGDLFTYTLSKSSVYVQIGKHPVCKIESSPLAAYLLAGWIGDQAENEKIKNGLLGTSG